MECLPSPRKVRFNPAIVGLSVIIIIIIITIHHHHLWLAPLSVRSTTGCQQPPEWSVLGQVDCVGP